MNGHDRPATAEAPPRTNPSLADLYGQSKSKEDWVYCWRCGQAITLEERDTTAGYDWDRGFYHARCPRAGTAPTMPRHERFAREAQTTTERSFR